MRKHFLVAAFICCAALPAAAQTMPATPAMPPMPQNQADMMQMMHRAAHNQLGVLEYCQAQGFIGTDVIDTQRRLITMLPPGTTTGLDEAEALGKRGTVSFNGNQVAIADAARAQSSTPEALCKQMGGMIQAQAANLPK